MEVTTIAVIGAGQAGRAIACAAALAGYRTVLEDVSQDALEQGIRYIRQALEDDVAGGNISPQQRDRALARLIALRSIEDACREASLLIETSPEEMEMKLEIFTIFDKFAKPRAILASATSSLSISDMAAMTFRPEDCVGMRFVDSTRGRRLVEIVRATETSQATVDICAQVGRRMGREVIVVRDQPCSSSSAFSE
jgi:3-hydroxybutyryl-CoA dehydrogenase